MAIRQEELKWIYLLTLLRLLRTLGHFALARKVKVNQESHFTTKTVLFIELSQISWLRVEISLKVMVQVVNQSTVKHLKMRILSISILAVASYQWQMLAPIQMAPNSL